MVSLNRVKQVFNIIEVRINFNLSSKSTEPVTSIVAIRKFLDFLQQRIFIFGVQVRQLSNYIIKTSF